MAPLVISLEPTSFRTARPPKPEILLDEIPAVAAMSSSRITPFAISEESMLVPNGPAGKLVRPDPSPVMVPVVTMF